MTVILEKEVSNWGREGDVAEVKDGYARNCLFPQRLAVLATTGSLKNLESKRRKLEAREIKLKEEAEALAKRLEGKKFVIEAKAGKEKLYGAVTAKEIAEKIAKEEGISLDKKKVALESAIKREGSFPVTIKVFEKVEAKVIVEVKGVEEKKTKEEKGAKATKEKKASPPPAGKKTPEVEAKKKKKEKKASP